MFRCTIRLVAHDRPLGRYEWHHKYDQAGYGQHDDQGDVEVNEDQSPRRTYCVQLTSSSCPILLRVGLREDPCLWEGLMNVVAEHVGKKSFAQIDREITEECHA